MCRVSINQVTERNCWRCWVTSNGSATSARLCICNVDWLKVCGRWPFLCSSAWVIGDWSHQDLWERVRQLLQQLGQYELIPHWIPSHLYRWSQTARSLQGLGAMFEWPDRRCSRALQPVQTSWFSSTLRWLSETLWIRSCEITATAVFLLQSGGRKAWRAEWTQWAWRCFTFWSCGWVANFIWRCVQFRCQWTCQQLWLQASRFCWAFHFCSG